VSAEEQGGRKLRTVKRFSKEYFELVRGEKAFADAQKLEGDVEMNVGGERVRVVGEDAP
jgi:hypothetical protein